MRFIAFVIWISMLAVPARAEAPKVATDIAPVHSLVAMVMQGVGEPELIMRPGASPHHYSMRPSEAAALQQADLAIWIGPELTPWLEEAIRALSQDADQLRLLGADGLHVLSYREEHGFGAHEHAEDHGGHDDHDDHDHEKHEGHDSHSAHAGDGLDPHAWLDPENGKAWLEAIAARLAYLDPANAGVYVRNAHAGIEALDVVSADMAASLQAARGKAFLVYHDAYHYFEARFDLHALAAIASGDAAAPGPKHLSELRDLAQREQAVCIFTEPEFDAKLAHSVFAGGVSVQELDLMGSRLEPGAALYPLLLDNLARDVASCLGADG